MLRHRRLLNLIENLPGDSAFVEAMANDLAVAEGIRNGTIKLAKADDKKGPRLSEWTPTMSLLAEMNDRLSTLITVTMGAAGAKNLPKIPPSPRPTSEVDRAAKAARERAKRENAMEIIRLFQPDSPMLQEMQRQNERSDRPSL